MDIDVTAHEIDKGTYMLLEQQVHVKDALVLHNKFHE